MNRSERRRRGRGRQHYGEGLGGVELPTVATDPGCEVCQSDTHVAEVMGAAMAWQMGNRFPFPQAMDCGCRILWIGHGMPPESVKP